MWPDLIQKAKDGGLDVIQTYVFWNGHEPTPGNVGRKLAPFLLWRVAVEFFDDGFSPNIFLASFYMVSVLFRGEV